MFVYAAAKGARLNLLNEQVLGIAKKGYQGILRHFIRIGEEKAVYLENTCAVAGLGGNPYRDGSYSYYVGEPRRTNDPKGVGAFLLASVEMEIARIAWL
jgi:unsaturated rhamnogalacturonyl hydrolase